MCTCSVLILLSTGSVISSDFYVKVAGIQDASAKGINLRTSTNPRLPHMQYLFLLRSTLKQSDASPAGKVCMALGKFGPVRRQRKAQGSDLVRRVSRRKRWGKYDPGV